MPRTFTGWMPFLVTNQQCICTEGYFGLTTDVLDNHSALCILRTHVITHQQAQLDSQKLYIGKTTDQLTRCHLRITWILQCVVVVGIVQRTSICTWERSWTRCKAPTVHKHTHRSTHTRMHTQRFAVRFATVTQKSVQKYKSCISPTHLQWQLFSCQQIMTKVLQATAQQFTNSNILITISLHFSGHFSRWAWITQYQNVSILDFIGAKGDGGGGDNWGCKTAKLQSKVTTNKSKPSFLQAG